MALTNEIIEKAKAAKSVDELIALAKTEGVELAEEKATTLFENLHAKDTELSDEELSNVAAGSPCGGIEEKLCPKCQRMNHAAATVCKYCGCPFSDTHPSKKVMGEQHSFI